MVGSMILQYMDETLQPHLCAHTSWSLSLLTVLFFQKVRLPIRSKSRHSTHILPADLWGSRLKSREIERIIEFESVPRYCEQVRYRYIAKILELRKEDRKAWAQNSIYEYEQYIGILFYAARKLKEIAQTKSDLTLVSPSTGDKILDECVRRVIKRRLSVRLRFTHISFPIRQGLELQRSARRGRRYSGFPTILSFATKRRENIMLTAQSVRSKIIVVSHPKSQTAYRWSAEHGSSKLNCAILTASELEKICFSLTSRAECAAITTNSLLYILKKSLRLLNPRLFADHVTTYILFRLRQLSINSFIQHTSPKGIAFFCNVLALERFFYSAFADAGLKTAYVDFSLGYNLNLMNRLNIQFNDFQRAPGFSVVFSRFRQEELMARPKPLRSLRASLCTPLLGTYASQHSQIHKFNRDKDLTIAIYDNVYADDSFLSSSEYELLCDFLGSIRSNIRLLIHSKNRHPNLSRRLSAYKQTDFDQGDFSGDINADIIFSVGFQGSALISASTFGLGILFIDASGMLSRPPKDNSLKDNLLTPFNTEEMRHLLTYDREVLRKRSILMLKHLGISCEGKSTRDALEEYFVD